MKSTTKFVLMNQDNLVNGWEQLEILTEYTKKYLIKGGFF